LLYTFKKPEIEIPLKLGNKKLTEEEINTLKKGKAVQFNYKGNNLYIQIDKELNRIVIKTQHQLKLSEVEKFELGGYVFTQQQKEHLEHGEKVHGVIMKGESGYFAATISIGKDNKSIMYENYKNLTKKQAIDLLKQRNQNNDIQNIISTAANTTPINEKENKSNKAIENTVSVSSQSTKEKVLDTKNDALTKYEQQLYTAIQNENFKELTILSKNQPPIADTFLNKLNKDSNIPKDNKIAAKIILGVNPTKEKEKLADKIKDKKEDLNSNITVEERKEKKTPKQKGVKRKALKEVINIATNDM